MARPYKSVLTEKQLRALAFDCRREVDRWLGARGAEFFDALEGALLDRADREDSGRRRQQMLDAARLMATGREPLAAAFRHHLLKAVETFFLHYDAYLEEFIHGFALSSRPGDDLQLIANDELEEGLVIVRTAHRATRHYEAAQQTLEAYLAAVVQPREPPRQGFPIAPQVVARCLYLALQGWEGGPAARTVCYEVLADRLLVHLDELYARWVQRLQRLGLEPVSPVEPPVRTAPQSSRPPQVSPPGREPERVTVFSVLGLTRPLDDEHRQRLGLMPAVAGDAPKASALQPEAVARSIGTVNGPRLAPAMELSQARQAQRRFKQSLEQTLRESVRREGRRLHCLDQQVVDLVTLLFDFMLEDRLLPDAMKVTLLRLQIPVMQVAVRDKTFLTDSGHPARRLVNNLSRAAVRWVGGSSQISREVQEAITRAVQRVVDGDPLSLKLYHTVNREFEQFMEQKERGARVVEERVAQVARGREQLALARERVERVLAELEVDALPPVAARILDDAWRDVMVLTHLREGEHSEAWRHVLEVARRLAEGARGQMKAEAFDQHLTVLLGDLRRGLASVSYDTRKSAYLLERLEACFRARNWGAPLHPEICGEHPRRRPASSSHAPAKGDGRFRRQVQALREGVWIRWRSGREEKRGKLAWRGELADIFLFVDMRGRKLAEFTSTDLEVLFREGRAAVLEEIDEPFIDRALRAIHRMITSRLAPPAGQPAPV